MQKYKEGKGAKDGQVSHVIKTKDTRCLPP